MPYFWRGWRLTKKNWLKTIKKYRIENRHAHLTGAQAESWQRASSTWRNLTGLTRDLGKYLWDFWRGVKSLGGAWDTESLGTWDTRFPGTLRPWDAWSLRPCVPETLGPLGSPGGTRVTGDLRCFCAPTPKLWFDKQHLKQHEAQEPYQTKSQCWDTSENRQHCDLTNNTSNNKNRKNHTKWNHSVHLVCMQFTPMLLNHRTEATAQAPWAS